MILVTLTKLAIFLGVIPKTTQFATFLTSVPQYYDHKFIIGYGGSMIEIRTGLDSFLMCGFQCTQKSLCTAINYCTATDGSSTCEFLATNICVSNYDRNILQPTPGCRFWDVMKNSSTCIMPTAEQCATLLPNCQPNGGPLCDTCIRTCREYYLRYNNKPTALAKTFTIQIWPKGILGPKTEAQCELGSIMYVFKRDMNINTGIFSTWNFNSSFQSITYTVERRIYSRLLIYLTGTIIVSSFYSVQSFQENGSLSVTFLPSIENYDVLGLNGNPLVNAPFLNDSNVNPECGPFWLLPEGNLSCPGGERMRFWGPVKYTGSVWDVGFRCAFTKSRFSLGHIRFEL